VWRKFELQHHHSCRYVARDDPEFEEKAADIIGLYLKSPVHAAVFCVDEKSAIQGLDRLDLVFPLSAGRADGTPSLHSGRRASITCSQRLASCNSSDSSNCHRTSSGRLLRDCCGAKD
jgi:hypothetical protein